MPPYPTARPGQSDRFPEWVHQTPPGSGPDLPLPPAPDPWAAKVQAQVQAATGGAVVPEYGSEAFRALPEDSPLRVAAALEAAEAWRTYWTPEVHARRLTDEIRARRAIEEAEVQERLVRQVNATANRMLRDHKVLAEDAAAGREYHGAVRGSKVAVVRTRAVPSRGQDAVSR